MIQRFRSRTSTPHVADHSKRPSKGFASGALLGSIMATSGAFYAGGQVSATAIGEFTVVDVAAGEDHVCAIVEFPDDSRKLYCWGVNDYRQLGIVNPSDDPAIVGVEIPGYDYSGGRPYATLPVEVLPSGDFTNTNVELISSGVRHTCAVESGTMFCWGSGNSGRLGNGDTDNRNLPTEVSAQNGFLNQNVTAISVGDRHTCAIESGVVYCWGSASDGRVGQPEGSSYLTPQVVSPGVDFINSGVQSVAAGSSHTCALKTGVVYCWGSGSEGRIGVDSYDPASPTYDDTDPHLPRKVSSEGTFLNASVSDIGVWGATSCAIEDGAMFCWGSGIVMGAPLGGDGYYPVFFTATPVSSGPDGFSNTSIESFALAKDATEGSHACAIKSGAVYCWGANKYGQLGNGNVLPTVDENGDPTYDATQLAPVEVVDHQEIAPVSTSEVGVTSNLPTYLNSNVTVVTGGQTFTCAIRGGNLYCWGRNDYGQLGTGDDNSTQRSIPWLVFNPSEDPGTPSFDFDIDLDHYRRAAEEMTSLPDTR
jgi:alpha-tubulin suppressor-like RCC1 family protein